MRRQKGRFGVGPFLALILNSRPKRESAIETQISSVAMFRRRGEATETQAVSVRPGTWGPFVSLILRSAERKATDQARARQGKDLLKHALCARLFVG